MDNYSNTKKSLGQHWLFDEASLQSICEAAAVSKNDVVLEIGPGLGTLTKLLVKKAKKVIAVELDEKLASGLETQIKADNLTVIKKDILSFDLNSLQPGYKIVANIPYYLTSHLIRLISETNNPPALATLLVQKEVAERINASPGKMSLLSVSAQYYWLVDLGIEVKANLFTPPPKVDSMVVILNRRKKPLFPDIDSKEFFRIVKAGFSQKRKTLTNSLSATLRLDKKVIELACSSVAIDPKRRAQTLSLQEWHNLYLSLNT